MVRVSQNYLGRYEHLICPLTSADVLEEEWQLREVQCKGKSELSKERYERTRPLTSADVLEEGGSGSAEDTGHQTLRQTLSGRSDEDDAVRSHLGETLAVLLTELLRRHTLAVFIHPHHSLVLLLPTAVLGSRWNDQSL